MENSLYAILLVEKSGFFEALHNALRKQLRKKRRRDEEPSAGIVDSQSVKTTKKGGIRGCLQS